MKVEVIRPFCDKYTYKRYEVGAVLDFEKDRAELAAKRGHVKILPVKKATKKKADTENKEEKE